MRIALVANPSAGGVAAVPGGIDAIARDLAAAGFTVTVETADTLHDQFAAARDRGVDAVIVAGGDGTIACAAEMLADTGMPFGILPLGTMNLLARDIGVPIPLPDAIAALADGEVREIDVGEVNGRAFLCASMLGMATRLGVRRERSRGRMGPGALWRFWVASLRAMRRYPPMTVAIDRAGRRHTLRTRALAVIDNDFAAAPGQPFARARLDGGTLALYVTHRMGILGTLGLAARMLAGRWHDSPGLHRFTETDFTIHSRRKMVRVMNDGETFLIEPPLRYRIRPKALKVIVPRAAPAPAAAAPPAEPEPAPRAVELRRSAA